MKGSVTVAKFYGIPIQLHFTFLLLVVGLAGWAWYQEGWMAGVATTGVLGMLFASVLLHELGHSRQAAKYGIKTRYITLLPIGGVASLERIPEHPEQEAKVAIAGPAVNLLLAALATPIVVTMGDWRSLLRPGLNPDRTSLAVYFFWINVFMFLFNLLPAFPMDGGRILRAGLAHRMDYARATSIASDVGRVFSYVFVLVGFFTNVLLIVVGIFIYLGASGEEKFVTITALLRGERVRDAMDDRFVTTAPEAKLGDVVRSTFEHRQSDFPVVDQGALVGLLDRQDILKAIQKEGGGATVAKDLMRTTFPKLKPDDRLSQAYRLFQESELRMLPVVAAPTGAALRGARPAAAPFPPAAAAPGASSPAEPSGPVVGILTIEDLERAYLVAANRDKQLGEGAKKVAAAVPGFGRAEAPRERGEEEQDSKKRDWRRDYI